MPVPPPHPTADPPGRPPRRLPRHGPDAGRLLPPAGRRRRHRTARPARRRPRSVIQIFLSGGLSAQESWDPKPEAPVEYRGPFGVVKTQPARGRVQRDDAGVGQGAGQAHRRPVGRRPASPTTARPSTTCSPATPRRRRSSTRRWASVVGCKFGPRNDLPPFVGVPAAVAFAGRGYLSSEVRRRSTSGPTRPPAGSRSATSPCRRG